MWFAVLPTTALSGKTLSVKLFGGKNTCTGEITELSTLKAGSAYSYSISFVSGGQEMEYVDLGLPSGLKWATCNLGATKPEEYGGYYQWAGLQDLTDTSIYLGWSNCPYHSGANEYPGWTKYVTSEKSYFWSGYGSPDNKTVLDPKDDIAHVKLGGKWRMPTIDEFKEIIYNCTREMTTLNGVYGVKFISKKNGNSIFLPAAGEWDGTSADEYVGSCGEYWSASLDTACPSYAGILCYGKDSYFMTFSNARYRGKSVRPVTE